MYDKQFYDVSEAGMIQSAEVLVPMIATWTHPVETMIDVGCGRGWWAKEFENLDIAATGIDGDYVADPVIANFYDINLEQDFPDLGTFDLALCLEVAEHLSPRRASGFIHDLCALAPIVVFSAAIPGQGGTGHINEQWPEYWASLFRAEGYRATGEYRFRIWGDDRIENWYRQNLIVAAKPGVLGIFDRTVLPLVHPVLWDHVRSGR